MEDNKIQFQRKNFYIKKEFQRNFIIKFCLLVMLGMILCGVIIYCMAQNSATTVFENSRIKIKSTADFILPTILLSGTIVTILAGAATLFITLFTSHKIAGPLYRFETDLDKVVAGDLTVSFKIRQNDQLQVIASKMNTTMRSLQTELSEVKKDAGAIKEKLEDMEKNGQLNYIPDLKIKIQSITNSLLKFKT